MPPESFRRIVLDDIDSTNAEALRRTRLGERKPLWIVARRQSAGRGRRGRAWLSLPGNLHATLLLVDPAPAPAVPQLSFVASLALHDAVSATAALLVPLLALKWPNDLLCAGKKIAGILIEGEGVPTAAAVGFGVNCCSHPQDVEFPATDLAATGSQVTAEALLDHLDAAMERRLNQWRRGDGFSAIRADWLDHAAGRGGTLRVRLADREITGTFETIDEAGRLLLRHRDGTLEAVAAGDVFPLHGISAHTGAHSQEARIAAPR
jgi:BirA family transcriptional regulator, biotin operon repressor / biotin---[acetyl-CoA-carboxylase] ligase